MALYRDIVAPRCPSLRKETTAQILAHSSEDAKSPIEPDRSSSLNEMLIIISRDSNHVGLNRLTANKVNLLLHKEPEGDDMAIVKHGHCVCSLGSKERTQYARKDTYILYMHLVGLRNKNLSLQLQSLGKI